MNEDDFQLVLRAKRQIQREAALRSFLVAGVAVAAVVLHRFAVGAVHTASEEGLAGPLSE